MDLTVHLLKVALDIKNFKFVKTYQTFVVCLILIILKKLLQKF